MRMLHEKIGIRVANKLLLLLKCNIDTSVIIFKKLLKKKKK
jgi:hypothetical protein